MLRKRSLAWFVPTSLGAVALGLFITDGCTPVQRDFPDGGAGAGGKSASSGQVTCTGSEVACGDVCVDTSNDKANCGRCGHDCQGGSCQASTCQPVILAAGVHGTTSRMAVDATSVYWTDPTAGTVMKVSIDGGSPITISSGETYAKGIAVDATSVYWTTDSGVRKAPISGGGPPVNIGPMGYNTGALGVDATSVYLTGLGNGEIAKMPIGGGSPTNLAAGFFSESLAVDATSVYFVTSVGDVETVPIGGGNPSMLASEPMHHLLAVALSGKSVYWADGVDSVRKIAIDGTSPVTLASGQATPCGIAVDDKNVYWTNYGGSGAMGLGGGGPMPGTGGPSTVMAVPLDGGNPVTLASGQMSPCAVAVDAKSVYWINADTVMKVAKE